MTAEEERGLTLTLATAYLGSHFYFVRDMPDRCVSFESASGNDGDTKFAVILREKSEISCIQLALSNSRRRCCPSDLSVSPLLVVDDTVGHRVFERLENRQCNG